MKILIAWKKMIPFFKKMARHFAGDFAPIIMVGDYHIGFFIILSAFLQPNIIFSGLTGLGITALITKTLKIDKSYSIRNTIYFNALLLGLFIGYLYLLDGMSLFIMFITMMLNVVFCFTADAFLSLAGLPLLSLPFSVIALLVSLTMKKFTVMSHAHAYFHEFDPGFFSFFSAEILHFLKSLGTLFCLPDPGFGLLLLLSVLIYSPLTAAFLITGHYVGASMEKMLAFRTSEVIQQHYYFNFSLIFTAIGGVFLRPSLYSLLWALIGTFMAVIFSVSLSLVFNYGSIAVMALPFNLSALFILRTLKSIAPEKLNSKPDLTPENSLEVNRLGQLRYREGEIGLYLPFAEFWTVQQGLDGEWTHKGKWKYAFDFVISKEGKTYQNKGLEREDYFCFSTPVYSPASGHIISGIDYLEDNKIEEVDNQNNWGNYLVIKSDFGHYVILAHLKKASLKVHVGQYVRAGEEVGLCGNSGYSRMPHLHIQVQRSPTLGAETVPFHFLNYSTIEGEAIFHGVPKKDQVIAPFKYNYFLGRVLNFKIGEIKKWKCRNQTEESEIIFEHKLDPVSGRTFWTDGASELFYSCLGSRFYFYEIKGETLSPLWDLYLAAPTIPIVTGENLFFKEEIPLKTTHSPIGRFALHTHQLLSGRLFSNYGKYQIDPQQLKIQGEVTIRGKRVVTHLKIDPLEGFLEFSVGERKYHLV